MNIKPVGYCIYCGKSEEELTREHVIPHGLNGTIILPSSSCGECMKVTSKMERLILRTMLGPLRLRLDTSSSSRRKKDRPEKVITYIVNEHGKSEEVPMKKEDFPRAIPGLKIPAPGIMIGRPSGGVKYKMVISIPPEDLEVLKDKGYGNIGLGQLEIHTFFRFVAKIAHSFAYTGVCDDFEPLLQEFIFGNVEKVPFELIGCDYVDVDTGDDEHWIKADVRNYGGCNYLYVRIKLFAERKDLPVYGVLVGRVPDKGT